LCVDNIQQASELDHGLKKSMAQGGIVHGNSHNIDNDDDGEELEGAGFWDENPANIIVSPEVRFPRPTSTLNLLQEWHHTSEERG